MDQGDHAQVSREGDCVNEQEEHKEGAPEPFLLCEPQQDEPGDLGAVLHCGARVPAGRPNKAILTISGDEGPKSISSRGQRQGQLRLMSSECRVTQ